MIFLKKKICPKSWWARSSVLMWEDNLLDVASVQDSLVDIGLGINAFRS